MKAQRLPFWKRHLPNAITWFRIFCFFPVIFFLSPPFLSDFWSAFFFISASISDFFDGYFARQFHVETNTGKFLDPIADKLLVTAALVMLIPLARVSAVCVVLLLSRDVFVGGLRAIAAEKKMVIGASWVGKWKTGAQMVAIPCLMIQGPLLDVPLLPIGNFLLWLSLGLSVFASFQYAEIFWSKKSL